MSDEIHLWLWQYTDELGKRRKTRYKLTEEQALARLKEPEKVEGIARDQDADGVDRRLSSIAAQVLTGKHVECAWELFRLQHFPGWEHERAAAALGLWSTRQGVKVTFEGRTVRNVPVIFVCFGT